MRKLMLAALSALALTGCAGSRHSAPPSSASTQPAPPTPPAPAKPDPCLPGWIQLQPDGSLNSAGAEAAIGSSLRDLAACRADRDRYRSAWPH